MPAPNPLTQPNQPAMPPTRTHSQVTNQRSKSPSQESMPSSGVSPQSVINKTPAKFTENNHQVETKDGPPSSIKKKLQWGNAEPSTKSTLQSCNQPGSCIVSKVNMKPEGDWTLVNRRQNPRKLKAPSPSPEPETECGGNCPK